jgi:hypothetical protein
MDDDLPRLHRRLLRTTRTRRSRIQLPNVVVRGRIRDPHGDRDAAGRERSGTQPSTAETGNIVFAAANVDDRIFQALVERRLAVNALATCVLRERVRCNARSTPPGQSILEVIQEAADAEFPGLAVVYVSAEGFLSRSTGARRSSTRSASRLARAARGHSRTGKAATAQRLTRRRPTRRTSAGSRGTVGCRRSSTARFAAPKGIKPTALLRTGRHRLDVHRDLRRPLLGRPPT